MCILRCTRALIGRVDPGQPVTQESAAPPALTAALGDWFAQPLSLGRRRYILLTDAGSRLPVVVPVQRPGSRRLDSASSALDT